MLSFLVPGGGGPSFGEEGHSRHTLFVGTGIPVPFEVSSPRGTHVWIAPTLIWWDMSLGTSRIPFQVSATAPPWIHLGVCFATISLVRHVCFPAGFHILRNLNAQISLVDRPHLVIGSRPRRLLSSPEISFSILQVFMLQWWILILQSLFLLLV